MAFRRARLLLIVDGGVTRDCPLRTTPLFQREGRAAGRFSSPTFTRALARDGVGVFCESSQRPALISLAAQHEDDDESKPIQAKGEFNYQDGVIAVPSGPGLGVRLARDKLAEYEELYRCWDHTLTIRIRSGRDGRR